MHQSPAGVGTQSRKAGGGIRGIYRTGIHFQPFRKIFIAENNEFDSSNHKNSSYDGWYLSRFACGDRGYSVISF